LTPISARGSAGGAHRAETGKSWDIRVHGTTLSAPCEVWPGNFTFPPMDRHRGALLFLIGLAACREPPEPLPTRRPPVEWPSYAGDPASTRYSPLRDIRPDNVRRLRPTWTWKVGEQLQRATPQTPPEIIPGAFEATPIMVGDTLYLSTPLNRAVALDASSGRELWSYDPMAYRWGRLADYRVGMVHRGVALWTGAGGRRVFLTTRGWLVALDAATGLPIRSFGDTGVVDLTRNLTSPVRRSDISNTSPPLVWGNLVIAGGTVGDAAIYPHPPPGTVQAFDAQTGALVWAWDPMPSPRDAARATWQNGSAELNGHMNVWSPFTIDSARGLLYLPVSAATNDWYGGNRPGDNLYSESLVCLDARTGQRVWHYQLVHHGLWDYDPASPPVLLNINREGRRIDIVAVAGKTGFVYVFDRVTGIPVWPIEERPVPPSDVPGEQAAPTQPFPTRPAPFTPQGITLGDLVDFTPALRRQAVAKVAPYRLGPIFTPPTLAGSVVLPGWVGGAGWGALSADPTTATLFVKATTRPILAKLVPLESVQGSPWSGYSADASLGMAAVPLSIEVPGRFRLLPRPRRERVRVPIVKPPYGTLTAIDLNTGEHRWQITLGDTPRVRYLPMLRHLSLPPLGVDGPPGGVVTASGLIFIAGGGRTLYAIDVANGGIRWQHPLKYSGSSNPMTYRTRDGRQYVVIATGAGNFAELRAFALQDR
jgi:quinoprotein glucose dehydrogenase